MKISANVIVNLDQDTIWKIFKDQLNLFRRDTYVEDGNVVEVYDVHRHNGEEMTRVIGKADDPKFEIEVAAFNLHKALLKRKVMIP